jgi:hypothetical protein
MLRLATSRAHLLHQTKLEPTTQDAIENSKFNFGILEGRRLRIGQRGEAPGAGT